MPPTDDLPPRYRPHLALPPYTYVPGQTPHPQSDPAGHAYGRSPEVVAPLEDANWSEHDAYLHAVDLFNAGYYWESHEAWEAVWHACGRRGPTADFLKGLIKLAAAGVKVREHRPAGVVAHARRAVELFRAAADAHDSPQRFGLSFVALQAVAESFVTIATQSLNEVDDVRNVRPLTGIALHR